MTAEPVIVSRSGRAFQIVRRGETNVIRIFFEPIDASNCAYGYVATASDIARMVDNDQKAPQRRPRIAPGPR